MISFLLFIIGSVVIGISILFSQTFGQIEATNKVSVEDRYIVIFTTVKTSDNTPLAVINNTPDGLKKSLLGNKTTLSNDELEQFANVIDQAAINSTNFPENTNYKYSTQIGSHYFECSCDNSGCIWVDLK